MKIVIATGGSGGHIFPALQTALTLRNRSHDVVFVGSLGLGQEKIKNQRFEFDNIAAKGFTKNSILGMLSFSWITLQSIIKAYTKLQEIKPQKVIGFGGYGSFSVVFAARILNIPIMIHEQNVYPGKANRLLAKFVKKIAISFKDSEKFLPQKKTIWTGCPCLNEKTTLSKQNLYQKFNLDPAKKTILVLGGSQGSQKINSVVFELICSLKDCDDLQFIVMTGKNEYPLYSSKYNNMDVTVRVFDFISPIQDAYGVSDLVIGRSGAATVCELGHFVLPSILIPYPLADGHQKFNARVLFDNGLAQMIEQSDLSVDLLRVHMDSMLAFPFDREQLRFKLKNVFKDDAALELALTLEKL